MDNYIISTVYDGKQRRLYQKVCENCNQTFYTPKHRLDKRRVCSRKCNAELQSRAHTVEVPCANCGRLIKRTVSDINKTNHGYVFCDRKCKEAAQAVGGLADIQPKHYRGGESAYRKRAIRKYGAVCARCGYSELEIMLDVDHVDGNRKNGSIGNLQVLCVWCHALKTRGVISGDIVQR